MQQPVARRMFDLTEPICLVNFFSEEPNEEMAALGFTSLLGRLLRRALRTARPRARRGRARGLLQLRPRRGRPAPAQGVGEHHPRGSPCGP
ncbi:hypothetical protein [Nocardioides convexus]|uniref:hypothetical protein n=1 Tax=Nocardioides convexus TaxID=2712224 RepID=UPI002418354C|nr:hypothetical protein [Nocardioides convexus]